MGHVFLLCVRLPFYWKATSQKPNIEVYYTVPFTFGKSKKIGENESMTRRGGKLREHILWTAKEVFLEMGFERASMDEVAKRAETSKRSLYAHFESKEKLFFAFVELVRGLLLGKLKMPGDYSEKPAEALAMFCGRYLELLLYEGTVQMCRVCMAETARFPEGAAQYFDVIFAEVQTRLAAYLKSTFGLSSRAGVEAAQRLLGQVLFPRFPRALFGVDPLGKHVDESTLVPDLDLKPIRKAVADFMESLGEN
jgi:AcrR family transcriptional regulator